MKIISWNCNMAFRKKYQKLVDMNPDLLVIQECEHKEKIEIALKDIDYNEIHWHGDNKHKGVATITFNNWHIKPIADFNPAFRFIIPLKLSNPKAKINLFNIWAMPHETERKKSYVGQIFDALNYYAELLKQPTILIGDFNSNAIWDKKSRVGNHSDVVKILKDQKIESLYHHQHQEEHGLEKQATLFLLKNIAKPFHIDYCFAPLEYIQKNTSIKIGDYDEWIGLSDHMPIIIENLKVP